MGGDEPWIEITAREGIALNIEGSASNRLMDAEVVSYDDAEIPIARRRFSFTPVSASWALTVPIGQPASLTVDNGDGVPGPEDNVPPDFVSAPGQPIDVIPPLLSLELQAQGGLVKASLGGVDPGTAVPPTIRYRYDRGPLLTYSEPLSLSVGQVLRAFATDASGNRSGLIETSAKPSLDVHLRNGPVVEVIWSAADGYVLETSHDPTGPWQRAQEASSDDGSERKAHIPVGAAARQLVRLRTQSFTR